MAYLRCDGVQAQIFLLSSNWDGGVRCWEVQEQGGQIRAMPKAQGKVKFRLCVLDLPISTLNMASDITASGF
jgi:hypothetical protein